MLYRFYYFKDEIIAYPNSVLLNTIHHTLTKNIGKKIEAFHL